MENINKAKCPFCGSEETREILFGLIQWKSPEAEEKGRKEYYMGGCSIPEEKVDHHCYNCKKDFLVNSEVSN